MPKSFRFLEQRPTANEIILMSWNPTMDLIALGTAVGEIMLYRLSWQKVWQIPPEDASKEQKKINRKVTALAWRPDGKILACGYDNGQVLLVEVAGGTQVDIVECQNYITSLNWIEWYDTEDESTARPLFKERYEDFLPKHTSCSRSYGATLKQNEETPEEKLLSYMTPQKYLNILAIGKDNGIVQLLAFGVFPTAHLFLGFKRPMKDKIISVTLSRDFKVLVVLMELEGKGDTVSHYYRSFHLPLLHTNAAQLKAVALKFGHITALMYHTETTMNNIREAWEGVCAEIDAKLYNYAKQKEAIPDGGSIGDDLLDMLMFGNASDALEKFLLHDLTASGLKKFAQSMENSYSNIKQTIVKSLQNVATSLYYHLNDFSGMAASKERFGDLGLDFLAIEKARLLTGSFLLKIIELQQVIDLSLRNFKAFFRWIYGIIMRLSDEGVPAEFSKESEQDLSFVAEFLQENFQDEYDEEGRKRSVKLERVAQYLTKDDLVYPVDVSKNPWITFLNENPTIRDNDHLIFKHYEKFSLIALRRLVKETINETIKGTFGVMEQHCLPIATYIVAEQPAKEPSPRSSHVWCPETNYLYTAITDKVPLCRFFFLLRTNTDVVSQNMEAILVQFSDIDIKTSDNRTSEDSFPTPPVPSREPAELKILDLQFYNKDMITVLLQEDKKDKEDKKEDPCPIIVQLPLAPLIDQMKPIRVSSGDFIGNYVAFVDGSLFVDPIKNCKSLDNARGAALATSGSRKVACVLYAGRRGLRLLEVDAEEEEEEDGDTTQDESGLMKDVSKLSVTDEMDTSVKIQSVYSLSSD